MSFKVLTSQVLLILRLNVLISVYFCTIWYKSVLGWVIDPLDDTNIAS